MTISVGELFDRCELHPAGVVQWGTQVTLNLPGVYVVASTPDLCDPIGLMGNYHPDPHAFAALKAACPSVTIDGNPASNEELAERINAFWIPDSAILYLGLAGTSVRNRVNQYYGTRIGRRSPHAGGWWLKTLAGLETLFVHYATTEAPKSKEALMLRTFADAVPSPVRRALHDSERIAPFANVAVQAGLQKRHGLAGYKIPGPESKAPSVAAAAGPASLRATASNFPVAKPAFPSVSVVGDGTLVESQVVSEKDRTRSSLRIPARSKFAFPAGDGFLSVTYQGQNIEARWRVNGSRSGTIGLGRPIMSSIGTPDGSIWMRVNGTSVVIED